MGDFNDIVLGEDILDIMDMDGYQDGEMDNFNKLDIIHLFGKEKIENIQKSLSKATGLAFVTVDFKGEPITESTYFTEFCQNVRSDPAAFVRCKASDAFGSIQAAVTRTPNVYVCPCGLLEVAIPIVVRDHYLGGFIGGQIACPDIPDSLSHLAAVMSINKEDIDEEHYKELRNKVPVYSYEKFRDIANLVFLVINQLSENEVSQQMQVDVLMKRIKRLQSTGKQYAKELINKNMEVQKLKVSSNPYGILDILTSLLNLSIIEDAPQTNELLTMLIDYVKYMYTEKENFVNISGELEHVEQYLQLQKKKLGSRLEYSIQIQKDMNLQKIPSNILMPYIQNAIYNGIMLEKEGGKISVTGYTRNNNLVLEIVDTGGGLSEGELDIKFEPFKDQHEGHYIKISMDYAREKVNRLFGEEYDIIIENSKNKGRKCILTWPERFEGRIE